MAWPRTGILFTWGPGLWEERASCWPRLRPWYRKAGYLLRTWGSGRTNIAPLARVTRFIREHGAVAGIQLAHAGRKASLARPWEGGAPLGPEDGGWAPVRGASPLPFAEGYQAPEPLDREELAGIVDAFMEGAERALKAGFQVVEIHGAHGYLLHSFLSPLSNQRTDDYGGSFENRTRLLREVVVGVREVWPAELPLLLRISCTDWMKGGWGPDDSVELARIVGPLGVDLVDCSSGGGHPAASPPVGPGYQTAVCRADPKRGRNSHRCRGLITDPVQADHIVRTGQADLVLLGRQFLREPAWPLRAARELGGRGTAPFNIYGGDLTTAPSRRTRALAPGHRPVNVISWSSSVVARARALSRVSWASPIAISRSGVTS